MWSGRRYTRRVTRRYRFRHVDVFTDRPFLGNPLAVFPEADGLSDAEMQALARELNLSETSFVLPPTDEGRAAGADYRMRIFTPGSEIPFAGHPSIGTAWVLADEGRFSLTPGRTEIRQEVAIGVLPLSLEIQPAAGVADDADKPRLGEITMTQGPPELTRRLTPDEIDELCEALEVNQAQLGWRAADGRPVSVSQAPPAVASTGLPFLVVPFRDPRMVADLDEERSDEVGRVAEYYDCESAALIAPGSSGLVADADVHARVFVRPLLAIGEDAATGSAAGPVAVYLGRLAGARSTTHRVVIEQGVEMGRVSRLVAEVDFDANRQPREVRVSGTTVPILEGWVTLS